MFIRFRIFKKRTNIEIIVTQIFKLAISYNIYKRKQIFRILQKFIARNVLV